MRVKIGSKMGSKPKNRCLSPSMKCDHKTLVIRFYGVLVQDSMLTPEYKKNLVKILESLLNQKVKWNYQLVDQDHILTQVQFREKDNLPKYQHGSQNFGQVQMDVMKSNFDFQNSMNLGSNQ